MKNRKINFRDFSSSGDIYSGTLKMWRKYRKAENEDNTELMLAMEISDDPDFFYNPDSDLQELNNEAFNHE